MKSIQVLGALAAPLVQAATLHSLPAAPKGWTALGLPAENEQLVLAVALPQQNIDQLPSLLQSVSDPSSASYGQYLSQADVESRFAPSTQAADKVVSWLSSAGIQGVSDGQSVHFAANTSTANALLSAQFTNYQDSITGQQKIRTLSYGVPDDVAEYVDFIAPTTFFGRGAANMKPDTLPGAPAVKKPRGTFDPRTLSPAKINATCLLYNVTGYTTIGPACLRDIYNIHYKADPNSGSRIGFGSFLNESASYADELLYEQAFGIPAENFTTVLINGGVDDQSLAAANGEANLDAQNQVGIANPLPITQFITGGSPPFIPNIDNPAGNNQNEPYLEYYTYLLAQSDDSIPQVISNSYGDEEDTVPADYAIRVCNMIGLLGLRGVTVIESSGDLGVGAGCLINSLSGSNTTEERFNAIFPATCSYLTAVGGTQSLAPEIAWTSSSGGFSDIFSQAYYQTDAVNTYLTKHIKASTKEYFSSFVNFTGRAFPDVAAHSLSPDYQVIYSGVPSPSGGTSAAAPVWAGVVGLLNDARLRAGLPVLGFLNPLLYTQGVSALTDVTGGQSVGCNGVNGQTGQPVPGAAVIPYATWNATKGWDPTTGLGLPDFGKLKDVVLKK